MANPNAFPSSVPEPSSSRRALSRAVEVKIVYRPIAELHPNPNNPRKHSKRQIRHLARCMSIYGFVVPLLVDRAGTVIAGHARLQAAGQINLTKAPTICLEHLSPAEVQALTIADNRLSELSEWNDQMLAVQLKELSQSDLDLAIRGTGFEMAEIDLLIEGLDSTAGPDRADTLPDESGPAVTKLGDLFHLGSHMVMCGSALDRSVYECLFRDERAAVIVSDPPYDVPVNGHVSGNGAVRHREFVMASGEMNTAEFIAFLTKACQLMAQFSTDGSIHYLFMDWRHAAEILAAGEAVYTSFKNLCVWVKDNGGMGSLYRSQHELVFVFKNGTAPHRNNIQLGSFGRYRTNVWKYPGANSFARKSDEGNLSALHPTVKPVQLIADAILDCSDRGEIVLDPFLGCGTTVIAAERTGRRCFGVELDPLYVDIIIRRWQAFTGRQAVHVQSGRTFDELAQEAANGR